MKTGLKGEIEVFIDGWHWDEPSEQLAFELGKFLFSFISYLEEQKLSDKTVKTHVENIRFIGLFEMSYGFRDEFDPENLEDGPNYEYEYDRKVSNSKYAIKAYEATWRKLDKFIKSGEYEGYLAKIEGRLMAESKG
ncbi:MAG: hypothetical protein AAGI38_22495 [Bacteroidota bacterium]